MREIKAQTIEEVLEAAKNAPTQTDDQKRATYEILLKLGWNEEIAKFMVFG